VLGHEIVSNPRVGRRWARTAIGVPVAAAVVGAPYLLLYVTAWDDYRHFTGDWPFVIAFFAAPLLGSFVFALMAARGMDRADWFSVGAFAFVMSLAMAGAWGSQARDEGARYDDFSFGWAISTGVVFVFLSLAGVVCALVLARLLRREGRDGKPRRIRPWHIGAAIAVVELATVGALIAKSG